MFFLGRPKESAVCAMNGMMRILYHSDVWVQRPFAQKCVKYGYHFVKAYRFLAHASYVRRERRFPLVPKLHGVEEIIFNMDQQPQLDTFWVCNPIVESCSCDEDFIGRTAFLCRSVSPRSTCQRSLERYLVQLMQVWKLDSEAR